VIRVAVTMPVALDDLGEFLADVRALDAAGADTIWLAATAHDPLVVLAAIAAVTHNVRLGTTVKDRPAALDTLQQLSRRRLVTGDASGETWRSVPMPPDRESWSRALREHEEAGVTGIVVPWDLRLLDLLRNPEPDDRSDLILSTG
jgi:alkanesulfonate monooxygenase SsuD/methylene tetrahydromethanopterin reductase-like flavin-dependent oxidoreductase (luciferase family)